MSPVAERTVVKMNPKGEEAMPIFETERYDIDTGERIPRGWERQRDEARLPIATNGEFTIPGPEIVAPGLQMQYMPRRRGRYIVAGQLEGRSW